MTTSKLTSTLTRLPVAICLLLLLGSAANAAPITFHFTFQSSTSAAQAVGSITFESTLLPNPGCIDILLPDPAVLALTVTVAGASSGNGTFTLNDFHDIEWCTNDATLDFSRELVGQPTKGDPWGTPNGNAGDFNLFGNKGTPAPVGEFFFALCADGGLEDCMVLATMRVGAAASAPALGGWGLILLAIGLIAVGGRAVRRFGT
jgi:hypothetical protein